MVWAEPSFLTNLRRTVQRLTYLLRLVFFSIQICNVWLKTAIKRSTYKFSFMSLLIVSLHPFYLLTLLSFWCRANCVKTIYCEKNVLPPKRQRLNSLKHFVREIALQPTPLFDAVTRRSVTTISVNHLLSWLWLTPPVPQDVPVG